MEDGFLTIDEARDLVEYIDKEGIVSSTQDILDSDVIPILKELVV
ncbi:MAG: hypothetical protein ABH804_02155 [archaeon]